MGGRTLSARATYPPSLFVSVRHPRRRRVRRGLALLAGYIAIAGVGYASFSLTAAWLAERIA